MIPAILVVVLMTAAAVGSGTVILRRLGLWVDAPLPERTVFSFAIGVGIIGWAGFFLALGGILNAAAILVLLVVMTAGLFFFDTDRGAFTPLDRWGWFLFVILGVTLFFDLLEGLSPPADADSLAYHFALPKLFLKENRLVFSPLAIDHAVPLLLQMTYMIALSTGGEQAMTFWTMVSGWGAAAMVFCVARRYLNVDWSLFASLLFITTPAVVYGAGSGQAEVRNAMFVVLAAVAGIEAVRSGHLRYAFVAGLAAGFFVASKYTGLVFVGVLGAMLLAQRRWLAMGAVYTLAIVIAGSQWYAWNWWNTGDPVFPMLFGIVEYNEGTAWNVDQATYFSKTLAATEKAVPANLLWLVLYPFRATISSFPQFESLRTGFGPYALLVLPIALAGAWSHRDRLRRSPLSLIILIAFAYYSLWFLFGPSQRVRHLLPVYPLLLIPLTVAAQRGTIEFRFLFQPAAVACAAVLLIQLAGQGLFTFNYARHIFTGETRSAFFFRNLSGFSAATWINENLSREDRLMTAARHFIYLLDVPVFVAHADKQAMIELRPDLKNPRLLWSQLRENGVTHILYTGENVENSPYASFVDFGCLSGIKRFPVTVISSRTLPSLQVGTDEWLLLRLRPGGCAFSILRPRHEKFSTRPLFVAMGIVENRKHPYPIARQPLANLPLPSTGADS